MTGAVRRRMGATTPSTMMNRFVLPRLQLPQPSLRAELGAVGDHAVNSTALPRDERGCARATFAGQCPDDIATQVAPYGATRSSNVAMREWAMTAKQLCAVFRDVRRRWLHRCEMQGDASVSRRTARRYRCGAARMKMMTEPVLGFGPDL